MAVESLDAAGNAGWGVTCNVCSQAQPVADIVFTNQREAEQYLNLHIETDHPGERTDLIQVSYWNGAAWQ